MDRRNPFHAQVRKTDIKLDVNSWNHLEIREGVIEALVQDDVEHIWHQHADDQGPFSDTEMNNKEVGAIRNRLPPRPSMIKELDHLKEIELSTQIYYEIVFLSIAWNAFRVPFWHVAQNPSWQLLNTGLIQHDD